MLSNTHSSCSFPQNGITVPQTEMLNQSPMTYEKMMRMRDQYITPEIKNKILSENKGLNQKTLDGFLGIEATDPERYDVFPDQEQEIPSPAPEPKSVSVSAERSDPVRGIPYLTAAFAGCCSRIRATTQAVQFIKYIQLSGRTACYIEMNESRYVKRLGALYSVAGHDPELGRVRYQNIDLYYKQSRISEILKLGYDYYVYDFGSFEDSHFNPAFFLDKSLPVAVMGSSPNEFDAMKKVIDATIDSDTRYIFSFVDEAEQPDILELMEDKAAHTTFVAYAPDPFVYLSDRNDIYSRIAVAGNPVARESGRKKARRGLFGRRGKT